MILSSNRRMPKDAFNPDLCKKCAEVRTTCCQKSPCSYRLTDFDEFNEKVLVELIESGYAIIYYNKDGYGIRPRMIEDKKGSCLQSSKRFQGTCIFLSDKGCLLSIEERPGIGINLIPKVDVEVIDGVCEVSFICQIDENYLDDPKNSFYEYRWVFEKVLIEKGELWVSPNTGKLIFPVPCGIESYDYYKFETHNGYNNFIQLCQGFLDSNINNLDMNDIFEFKFDFYVLYADYDKENIYNLWLMQTNQKNTIPIYLSFFDKNLLTDLFGEKANISFDGDINLSKLRPLVECNYESSEVFTCTISTTYGDLYDLCYEKGKKEYVMK